MFIPVFELQLVLFEGFSGGGDSCWFSGTVQLLVAPTESEESSWYSCTGAKYWIQRHVDPRREARNLIGTAVPNEGRKSRKGGVAAATVV